MKITKIKLLVGRQSKSESNPNFFLNNFGRYSKHWRYKINYIKMNFIKIILEKTFTLCNFNKFPGQIFVKLILWKDKLSKTITIKIQIDWNRASKREKNNTTLVQLIACWPKKIKEILRGVGQCGVQWEKE